MIELSIDPRVKLPRISKSVRILDKIEELGGMRTKDIQREAYRLSHPEDPTCSKMSRGYWCTNLFGGNYYGPGLMGFFCEKRNGKWRRRADRPHNGKPWREIRLAYEARHGHIKSQQCGNCGRTWRSIGNGQCPGGCP